MPGGVKGAPEKVLQRRRVPEGRDAQGDSRPRDAPGAAPWAPKLVASRGSPAARVEQTRSARPAGAISFKYFRADEHVEILQALREGEVVWRDPKPLFGATDPQLVWARGLAGKLFQAVFRTDSPKTRIYGAEILLPTYRQEIAAYELSEGTGLGLIPPTVERTLDGQVGSLQILLGPTPSIRKSGKLPGNPEPPPGEPAWVLRDARILEGGGPGGPRVDRADFDKLMAFDFIFRNRDRTPGNFMTPVLGFDYGLLGSRIWEPRRWTEDVARLLKFVTTNPHPSSAGQAWIQGINPRVVQSTLETQGYPPEFIAETLAHTSRARENGLPWP
jgi:hypothetical protein